VPLARMLSKAGWEPERHATVAAGKVVCERFGAGREIYYTVYNDGKAAQACTLQIDFAQLGLNSGAVVISEVGHDAKVERAGDRITLEVPAKKTYVLKVSAGGAR